MAVKINIGNVIIISTLALFVGEGQGLQGHIYDHPKVHWINCSSNTTVILDATDNNCLLIHQDMTLHIPLHNGKRI